jgi:hypothetical protein
MVTLTEVIKFQIKQQAGNIHQLKKAHLVEEKIEKYAYIAPDGRSFRNRLPGHCEFEAGWKWGKVQFTKLLGHIAPRHPQWKNYRAAQNQASLLLTARLILKLSNGDIPSINIIRNALKKGGLANHARRGGQRSLCYRAYRYLRKIDNRLTRAPQRFADVETWIYEQ